VVSDIEPSYLCPSGLKKSLKKKTIDRYMDGWIDR
jgi:hypothetical protein